MHQFEIKRLIPMELFGYDISFTNASLFMVLALVLVSAFLITAMSRRSLVPGRLQSIAESTYEFVANIVRENLGQEGMRYFPWVFSIFIFILALNMLGMVPGSFTVTSHIIVTFALAAMVWLTVTFIGFARHGVGFLKLFVPHGVPFWLMPLIVPIELDLVFHPAHQPLGALVRQHDGRPYHAEGVRGLRGDAPRIRQGGAGAVHGSLHGSRVPGGLPPGVHLHGFDLHLPQRRGQHASLTRAFG